MGSILIKYSEKDKEGLSILRSLDWLLGEWKQIKQYRTPQPRHKIGTRGFKAKSHIPKLSINVLKLMVLET